MIRNFEEYVNKSKGETTNFSGVEKNQYVLFSCADAALVSAEPYKASEVEKLGMVNFASASEDSVESTIECFSVGFLQFIMEEERPARDSLKRRVQQVVNYVKGKKKEDLMTPRFKRLARKYIYMFLLQKIQEYMKALSKKGSSEGKNENKKDNSANLILALGIGPYISDKKAVTRLQMVLKMLIPQLKRDGTLPKNLQPKIKESFSSVFKDMLRTIEKKFIPEEKHGCLSSVANKQVVKTEEPEK